jgi:hypothetical protein
LTSGTYGKFPNFNTDNIQVMEFEHFLPLLSNYLPDTYSKNEEFKSFLRDPKKVSLYEYVDVLLMTLPTPRVSYYESTNYEDIQRKVSVYTNKLADDLGSYAV